MSQIALTLLERRAALERFGYSEREAEFLCLAGLHGGYFLRRQYACFLGTSDGGNVTQLIEKALNLGHAEAATYKSNVHIYHLAARPFYAAIGQEDNRNRRRKEAITIKTKLMGLDFVLAHPDKEYLTTEQEKVAFFNERFSVEPHELPVKHYAGRGEITERYFVEKYPIFWLPSPEPASPPVVSFCFVDPGLAGVVGFETFLSQYGSLFSNLHDFEVIYVAAKEVLFPEARTAFQRFSDRCWTSAKSLDLSADLPKILEYFEARRLFEAKEFASFDRAKLIRFRDQQVAYGSRKIEALYKRWKTGGSLNGLGNLEPKRGLQPGNVGHFSTYLLDYSYDLFGSLTSH